MHTDEEPEYLAKIVDFYKQKIIEIKKNAPAADSLKTAILTGIIIADELFKERERPKASMTAEEAEEASVIAERLLRQLEESLQ